MGEGGKNVIKFFVTNLPEKSSAKEIGDFFCAFGDVVGVYVARKRDNVGNRFGFISFSGARNRLDLEESLKSVRMGNNKLRINIARFASENSNESIPKEYGPHHSQRSGSNQVDGGLPRTSRPFVPNPLGSAYRDILVGNSKNNRLEEKVVEVSSFVKPFVSWLGKSLIVRTSGLSTLVKMDKLMENCVGLKVQIKYVGGLYLLLVFDSLEEMLSFKESDPNAKDWFSWMEVWEGQVLPFERIAWLKISGVPIQLLDNEVFDSVGRLFRKVVHASSISIDSSDLTYDLVGVLIGDGGRISEPVTLKWKDRKFVVWVHEETGEWVPDCIYSDESWKEGSDSEPSDDGKENSDSPKVLVLPAVHSAVDKGGGKGEVRQPRW
ncbi:putative RNA recognition motif domain, nucleotide-binding alpha-beta plait domain superfamily [Helianthus annuus]|nr:putative RNA recognition motif domain, nucleotide-binding alpha-beta plait domain superfamily [Helianthus annuus]